MLTMIMIILYAADIIMYVYLSLFSNIQLEWIQVSYTNQKNNRLFHMNLFKFIEIFLIFLFILFLINHFHVEESSCCTYDKGLYKMFNDLNDPAILCYNSIKFIGSIYNQYDKDAKF
jgi:hypothetical protein